MGKWHVVAKKVFFAVCWIISLTASIITIAQAVA